MTQFILKGTPQTPEITEEDNNGHVTVKWKQGINQNIATPWGIEARIFLAKDATVLCIYQIILLEPMCDSFSMDESEHEKFLPTIEQIVKQKAA